METDVLMIDEVSMMSAKTFGQVESVLRLVRDPALPFGGIQVILCGDLLQVHAIHCWPVTIN